MELQISAPVFTKVNNKVFKLETLMDEDENILVRKSEIIYGIKVCLDEVYVLSPEGAESHTNYWIRELNGFTLN